MSSLPTAWELAQLSIAQRLELMNEIWTSLGSEAQSIPVPEWHVAEIKRRLEAFAADGELGRPADEALGELKRRL
jgi:putative addiction module component (TIGR02574 family)